RRIVEPLAAAEVLNGECTDRPVDEVRMPVDDAAYRGHVGASEMAGCQDEYQRPPARVLRQAREVVCERETSEPAVLLGRVVAVGMRVDDDHFVGGYAGQRCDDGLGRRVG